MGKTTLCNALMGMSPPRAEGSVIFEGEELMGSPSYKIARRGIGYVPQGRRLFRRSAWISICASQVEAALRTAPHGRASVSTSCFRGWQSGEETAARSSPAVSSRCLQSGAHS